MWTRIAWGTFIFITTVLRVSASSSAAAIVHSSAQLTCNQPCSGVVEVKYAKMYTLLVTTCKLGSCHEAEAFRNRTEMTFSKGSWCLQLHRVQYNDDGLYIFFCDSSVLCRKPLHVIAPVSVKVAVGDNVTIPFYARTRKMVADNEIMYHCEKDGDLLITHHKRKTSYGLGFQGRAFLSLEAYKHGDLSLTIINIQHSDEGTIHCTHAHEEPVHPEATTLSITVSTSATDLVGEDKACSSSGEGQMRWLWWATPLENIVLLAFVCACYFLYKKWPIKKQGSNTALNKARSQTSLL